MVAPSPCGDEGAADDVPANHDRPCPSPRGPAGACAAFGRTDRSQDFAVVERDRTLPSGSPGARSLLYVPSAEAPARLLQRLIHARGVAMGDVRGDGLTDLLG